MEQKIYRVGGRDSRLEQNRSRQVFTVLQARAENFAQITVPQSALDDTELLLPKTLGSVARTKAELGLLFRALQSEQIDMIAVNVEDLPRELPAALCLAAVPTRQDARDVLALPKGMAYSTLEPGSVLLSTGLRRTVQLNALRSDLVIRSADVSLEEQLGLLEAGEVTGVVAAAADLMALGMEQYRANLSFRPFAVTAMVPGPGQGLLAVICRRQDQGLRDLLALHLEDSVSRACLEAERFCAAALGLGLGAESGDRPAGAVYVFPEGEDLYLLALNQDKHGGKPAVIRQRLNRSGENEADPALMEAALQSILGHLSYVGCDPHDPELLTLRAAERIRKADRVFYTPELRPLAKLLAEQSPAEFVELQEGRDVVEVLADEIRQGLDCVRLLPGDPFLYGSGSRELEQLRALSLAFDIVPGVSSLMTWPLYAGIPLVHPELSRHVHVFDGRVFPIADDSDLAGELAHLNPLSTLVFYQAATRLPDIVASLKDADFDMDRQAALITAGTSPAQRVLTASVAEIAQLAVTGNVPDPAVLVIGEVTRLRETLAWWPPLGPMSDMHFMELSTTGLEGRSESLAKQLRSLGAAVYSWELAREEYMPYLNDRIEQELIEALERKQNGRRFERSELWLALSGRGAVLALAEAIAGLGLDHRLLAGVRFAVCDQVTAVQLAKTGFEADYLSPSEDQDEMAAYLAQHLSPSDFVLAIGPETAQSVMTVVLQLAEIPSVSLQYAEYVQDKPEAVPFLDQLAEVDNIIFHDAAAVREFAELLTSLGMDTAELAEAGTLFFPAAHEAAIACAQRGLTLAAEPSEYKMEKIIDSLKSKALRRREVE